LAEKHKISFVKAHQGECKHLLELIDFPFDQYQRYRITQEIADMIRCHLGRTCLSVLDVGGFFRAITGDDMLPIAKFLPDDTTVVVDLAECAIPSYVQGSGTRLPFADESFDVVSTCDTLEHVPPAKRLAFVDELLRVAAHYVILAAPFDDERTRLAEQIIFDYVKAFYNFEQPQLQEHIENGLPDQDEVRNWLDQHGYPYADFASGYLHHWLPMMLLKHYLFGHPRTARLHVKIDRYYNVNFYHLDHRTPGYRHVFVISKSVDNVDFVAQVSRTFQPQPGSPADDGAAFARSLLTLIEWEREWQREQEQGKLYAVVRALKDNAQVQELVIRAQELNELRDLVERSIHPGVAPVPARGESGVPPVGEGVLLISPLCFDQKKPAPAARYWELARVLSHDNRVTLVGADSETLSHPGLKLLPYGPERGWETLVAGHQTVVVQCPLLLRHPDLSNAIVSQGKYLVIDLYDPFPLASLPGLADVSRSVRTSLVEWSSFNEQIKQADFFLCSDERQRDFWLGMLGAHFRLNPHTYRDDPTVRRLIDLVPFGLPSEPPVHKRRVLKGVHPRVASTDKLAVWLGELDARTDPLTLLQAWASVVAERQDAKLLFICTIPERRYAQESAPEMERRAVHLSKELGLYNRFVFFHAAVPYEARQNYLLEADLGLYLHAPHLATWYTCSAPLLDYVWAGLPMITTRGNSLERVVDTSALGRSVEPGDVSSLTAAILDLLHEPQPKVKRQQDFARVASHLTWDRVAEPLNRYCQSPWRAADRRVPEYAKWSSTVWQRLLIDRIRTQEHIETLRNGRMMRLMATTQRFWQRIRGGDKTS